jgi:hypothetical protein
MAENFFTGLTGALQQNAKQRNNDDYIELMRQKQLQSEMSGALADKRAAAADVRADEEMGMKREAAIRTQKDFDFRTSEAERKRAEEAAFRNDVSSTYQNHFGAVPEKDKSGNDVLDEKGSVKMRTPSQDDPMAFSNYLREFTGVLAKHGKLAPDQLKQLTDMKSAMEKDGTLKALQGWMTGAADDANALAKKFGYDPKSMKMAVEQDPKTKLFTPYLYATSLDGKQFKQDLTVFQMAMGLPATDVSTGANSRIVSGSTMLNDERRTVAAETSARAQLVNAMRPRGGGGGGSGEGGVSSKIYDQTADNIKQMVLPMPDGLSNPAVGDKVPEDYVGKSIVAKYAGLSLNKGEATDPLTAATMGLEAFQQINNRALELVRGQRYGADMQPASEGKTWDKLTPLQRQAVLFRERERIDRAMHPSTARQEAIKKQNADNRGGRPYN